MKHTVLSTAVGLMLLGAGSFCLSQEEGEDILYLKNGKVVHGQILEIVPNKEIRIKTSDGKIKIYEMTTIVEMKKESAIKDDGHTAETVSEKEAPSQTLQPTRQSLRAGGQTQFQSDLMFGGLIYEDFFIATGARLGAAIEGKFYVGMTVATTLGGDVTAYMIGGEFGYNIWVREVSIQPCIGLGVAGVGRHTGFYISGGTDLTYWINESVGVGIVGKYVYVPEAEDGLGALFLTAAYNL